MAAVTDAEYSSAASSKVVAWIRHNGPVLAIVVAIFCLWELATWAFAVPE